ncbi:MAG: MBL fold hydrolase [Chloroflexi bacterium CG_4_10_14_0_8_um_filter_46_9]|nr:MAG: MBL fold hydrolase [Dehalococcoidia bacterium CG2_30_46_19]PIW40186.1 MAG: MBL fold hydrolase [Chloroflexi bacterium CG15_BIG_FIL_POST_REV_8_21_14_020_46_15]PIZ26891.1 MAG: MBL fold hydrolase [Chloroflexi bacterium CG_4_10_14_0_8_um_filter_46_9]
MKPRKIRSGVYWVGAIDWDRRLFDELIPLPDGTSYNSYLIKGSEKTALIDTVDPSMESVLLNRLKQAGVKNIDYVIANHAEQDHSGTIPPVLEKYPTAKVVTTPRGKDMLIGLLLIPEDKFITVSDGETLSLGDKTLEFIHAPWVHWPETMLTYLREDKVLFPCDLFGSHLATTDLYVTDEEQVYEAAKRYYAEIMMPFHTNIQNHLEKLKGYEIDIIAPSHGPVYDKPSFILEAYRSWVFDPPKNIVVLPYISMHGSTKEMVDYLVEALAERGVTVRQFNMTKTDIGKLAIALVDAATMVIGTPTIMVGPHPNIVYAAFLANALRPKLQFVSIIGSYGWGGKAVEQLQGMIPNLKVEVLQPVIIKGFPKEADFQALNNLADTIVEKHKEHNFA